MDGASTAQASLAWKSVCIAVTKYRAGMRQVIARIAPGMFRISKMNPRGSSPGRPQPLFLKSPAEICRPAGARNGWN